LESLGAADGGDGDAARGRAGGEEGGEKGVRTTDRVSDCMTTSGTLGSSQEEVKTHSLSHRYFLAQRCTSPTETASE